MIIGIDLDDVVLDFNTSLAEYHNRCYGTSYTRADIVGYDLWPLWGCSRAEAIRRVHEFYYSAEHERITPLEGASHALRDLARVHSLVVITSRPTSVRDLTMSLLDRHFPRVFSDVHFLGHYNADGSPAPSKGEACRQLGAALLVEDALPHAVTASACGVSVLLFDSPWNQGAMPPNTERVFGWHDILDRIERFQ